MLHKPFLSRRRAASAVAAILLLAWSCPTPGVAASVQFNVTGADGQPLPCRIHLLDAAGRAQRAGDLPFWRTHFNCPGSAKLQVPMGTYTYQIERGCEYRRNRGTCVLDAPAASAVVNVRLERIVDMAADGWYSGDLHVHRPIEEMDLLMRAEDLHVAPVITWWNARNTWADRPPPDELLTRVEADRYYRVMAGEDEREGGALMFFNLDRPLAITGSEREYPSPMKFVREARRSEGAWIDIEKPFWWDVPVWLASGQTDSIGLANNHMCHAGMLASEAWGRPRDERRLPPPRGNGFWTQEIYYHVLEAGLRVPPSAGSASGVLPNPLGYNRVYVQVEGDFTYEEWWDGLKAGRSFVTNGPILRVEADGHPPGHVFTAGEGESVTIELDVSLVTQDNVPAIEVIRDGRVERAVAPDQWSADGPQRITFDTSGWFLVRAISDKQNTFRFASTAPYYVEVGPRKQRVSRRSVQFFLDWIDERMARVPNKLEDPAKLGEVLAEHQKAKQFWTDRLQTATAE